MKRVFHQPSVFVTPVLISPMSHVLQDLVQPYDQAVDIRADALDVQAGEVVHQGLDLGRLGWDFGIALFQLVEHGHRLLRAAAHFDVEDPG